MLITDQKPFEIINHLILVNNDRVEGYKCAWNETEVPVLKALFTKLTETSLQCIFELSREVYKLGAKPKEGAIASVDLFKAWMEMMAAIGKNDHLAILNSCSHEKEIVIKNYEMALCETDENITTQHFLLFNRQQSMLMEDHEKVTNLLNVLIKHN